MNICDSGISLNEFEDIIKDIEMFSPKSKIPARIGMYKIKPLLFLSVVLFIFSTNGAVAQTDTLKLTFQDAEKQFLENNNNKNRFNKTK